MDQSVSIIVADRLSGSVMCPPDLIVIGQSFIVVSNRETQAHFFNDLKVMVKLSSKVTHLLFQLATFLHGQRRTHD